VSVTETSVDSYIRIPVEKPQVKEALSKKKTVAVKQTKAEAPNLLTRIKRNVFGTTEQVPARKEGEIYTPERLLAEIDAIRSVVRVVHGIESRGESRRDFRSPRDYYYYSPRRRRRSRRYQRWSDSLSSSSWSEDTESSPIRRRPRRQRRRRRRRRADYD